MLDFNNEYYANKKVPKFIHGPVELTFNVIDQFYDNKSSLSDNVTLDYSHELDPKETKGLFHRDVVTSL